MISVVINAKNEEKMIKTALESVKWADEIIVILNNSIDRTEEVAKKYTDKIIKTSEQDFSYVKNKGMSEAKEEWVLFIDADERVLKPLEIEIISLVKTSEKVAFALSRKNIIFGKEVNYGPYQNDRVIRLVRKDKSKGWVGKVHEHLEFDGNLGYTKNPLLHLTHRGVDHFVSKALEWSNIDARLRFETKHPKMSGWRFLRIFITETFNQGVIRGGFFNGTISMMDSLLQVFSMYITYVRLWELQQKESLEDIYEDIDRKLLENGFHYQ